LAFDYSEKISMNNLLHRYKIWQLAGDGRADRDKPAASPSTRRQVEDLVALMALYDYRPLIDVELRGSFSINGSSVKCKTTSISPEAVNLVCDPPATPASVRGAAEMNAGSRVHLNLDQIGPFRGVVASKKAEAVRITVDDDDKPKLRTRLSRMAAERAVTMHEDPKSTKSAPMKIEPTITACSFVDHTGTIRRGVVVNITQVDVLIKARIVPPVGSRITFRGSLRQTADVTRNFELGFVARFCSSIPVEAFTPAIKFSDE
jgi:hypothetical protein